MPSPTGFEELTSLEALGQRLQVSPGLLLDVFGHPCDGCTTDPARRKIAKAVGGRIALVSMNANEVPDIGLEFGIQMIPALLLFVWGSAAPIKYPLPPDKSGTKVARWVQEQILIHVAA